MLFSTPIITIYTLLVTGLFGLVMGSFLNCLAWRITHGESVLRGRSHCTSCGHVLGVRDLVPVLSWLSTRGRCRYCGERVSARYPATELLCAAVYVSIVVRYDITLEAVEMLAFASVLLVLSLTDIDKFIIPNSCILAAIAIRVAYVVAAGSLGLLPAGQDMGGVLLSSLVSALAVGAALVVIALVMDRVLGRESVGGGDVKLLAVAAFYFGWQQCLLLLVVACVIGIVVGMVQLSHAVRDLPSGDEAATDELSDGDASDAGSGGMDPRAFPWGPSIALACWFCMLFGSQIISWYMGLFV